MTVPITDGRKLRAMKNRKAILDAAREIFLEKGFVNNSMLEISQRAGVGYGTIYTHFRGKDDILRHLIDEIMEDLEKLVTPFVPSGRDQIKEKHEKDLRHILNVALKNRPILKVAFQAYGHSELIQNYWDELFGRYLKIAENYLREAQNMGLIRPEYDISIVSSCIVFTIKEFFWNVVLGREIDFDKVCSNVPAIFMHGLYRKD
ncbi:MAG TPA: TetR/AcrR family transcriptional regulator [Bacillota bacterium]|nr:TetR/AcrR family transcriptional regulator [Bacillota bacterium]HOP69031.1 TetR/AcrR family transcriptional regulator [Bacillota bacterium]HPT33663.1 TetR/AcrR family transcriptional regulator [Bacillota bacterium]HPZ65361.1 TetR/AcrR family transcriptional regulator [Bacillota bacterium]HQD06516.1 TetR/AcrR family transcriptional regulator [Bacillota bacterium]